jgi:hypothetical protein
MDYRKASTITPLFRGDPNAIPDIYLALVWPKLCLGVEHGRVPNADIIGNVAFSFHAANKLDGVEFNVIIDAKRSAQCC